MLTQAQTFIAVLAGMIGAVGSLLLAVRKFFPTKGDSFDEDLTRLQKMLAETRADADYVRTQMLTARAEVDRLTAEVGRLTAELARCQIDLVKAQGGTA